MDRNLQPLPCRPAYPAAGPTRAEGGSRPLAQPVGLLGRWTGAFNPQPRRQLLGVATALGFKIREIWGPCDIGQVPNLVKSRLSHLSNGDNYYPNFTADLGPGGGKPGAQFKEALALRCQLCTCRSLRAGVGGAGAKGMEGGHTRGALGSVPPTQTGLREPRVFLCSFDSQVSTPAWDRTLG